MYAVIQATFDAQHDPVLRSCCPVSGITDHETAVEKFNELVELEREKDSCVQIKAHSQDNGFGPEKEAVVKHANGVSVLVALLKT